MKVDFLDAGEIVATHGIKGEIKVLPWSDGPEFLLDFNRLRIGGKTFQVEQCRVQKTCNLIKLDGIETVDQAQMLRGKTVQIFRQDAPDELIFAAELIGMDVYAEGVLLGQITDVLDYPGNKVYVIQGEYNYMIPAVNEFVLETNLFDNKMIVKLIEGMRTDEG